MALPSDFPLPRFETYSTGENAGYETSTIAAASLSQENRPELLRDRLRTITADRNTKIGVARSAFSASLSRAKRNRVAPEVAPHEVSLSASWAHGWGSHDETHPRPCSITSGRSLRDFASNPGSIPAGAIVETGTAWAVTAAVEPAVLFLPANTPRHLVGISVGIGSSRRRKLMQLQPVMVLSDCRPGAPSYRPPSFADVHFLQ